ncbi:RNA polymerase sigma factor sigF, chloroplastic isoform X4 [Eucalyptus grandis]|uniref:RNA polymerase sigma factor sigF, chloroplastic isoform X4 n=1 Tax=Eucalyptus grandis TaxID=71139 RepID=UPI00192EA9CD|nr:RNA polymerase sigma factor sigF, chloroplastic isoform X4 [Eucalyptus grandis]
MESARNLLSSSSSAPRFPRRVLSRNSLPAPPSVFLFRDQGAVPSAPSPSRARAITTSVSLQEQQNEYRPLLRVIQDDKSLQVSRNRKQMETGLVTLRDKSLDESERLIQDFVYHRRHWPGLWYPLPSIKTRDDQCSNMQSVTINPEKLTDNELSNVVSLAKKALEASREAASLADPALLGTDLDFALSPRFVSFSIRKEEVKTVRSTRLIERQSKMRRVPKPKDVITGNKSSKRLDAKRKANEGFDPNDPIRMFLWGPETKQLLTFKEESELILKIQDLLKLEQVKARLQSQSGREPTLLEWAEAIGITCRDLQSQLHSGYSCREKLINANLRLVVHIAKQYQGRGLSLPDLLQEGSMGLMKSVGKFKPQAGCRFATYAYWWIRQTVRKAIFQNSRTIRLPENVYALLGKVMEAKRSCIQEGHRLPSKEQVAKRAGISVDKLQNLVSTTRTPLSLQQPVWSDQDTTFQEITADTGVEIPDLSVSKQLMRRHVRSLLSTLSPKERQIIKLRYGIDGGEQRSLSDIGNIFGLSKERVRQLESRAVYKLKQCLGSHGLHAYGHLVI